MATQSVRNIMNNSIARIIPEVKKRVKEEGMKKLEELQQQLLSPETIIATLQPEINNDTCSEKGKKLFQEKVDKLEDQVNEIEEQINKGLSALQVLEDKISPITTAVELPPGIPNPIETLNGVTQLIQPLTDSLNLIILAAPGILAASSGPVANGAVIAGTNNNVRKAKSLVKEFVNLIKSIPKQLNQYQRMGDGIFRNIENLKTKLQGILTQTGRLKSFILYLEMDFIDKCGKLEDPSPPENLITGETIPPQMAMDELIAEIELLYGNMLDALVARGDTRAIERTFILNEKFERIKNIRIRTIKI